MAFSRLRNEFESRKELNKDEDRESAISFGGC